MYNYRLKLVDSSRFVADLLVNEIGKDHDKFSEMIELAFLDEYPMSMRAARVIALVAERYSELVVPHLQQMVDALCSIQVEGVKRSFLKIFAEIPVVLDEDMTGLLTDYSFNSLADPKEAIAIRYYAIEILMNVTKSYPELKFELQALLKSILDDESTALHAKSRKVLKELKKTDDLRTKY